MKLKEFLDVFDLGISVSVEDALGRQLVQYDTGDEDNDKIKEYYDYIISYATIPPQFYDVTVIVRKGED